jgi:FMN phosphatase YigB (HAD superfamily)
VLSPLPEVFVVEPMSTRRQALLVDLDGTLYRGDGPVRTYAQQVADTIPAEDRSRYLSIVDNYLARGVAGVTEPELLSATDGWEAVQRLAIERFGVEQATLDVAFLASRRALALPECAIDVPVGFLDALRGLRADTHVVLATNSPRDGLPELLARLGAAEVFDDIVCNARKPIGMPGILMSLAAVIGTTDAPWRIFSVGDHWHNDIAPARVFGAVTGYIDRFGRADGPADVVAPDLEGVLPTILRWAGDPDAFRARTADATAPVQ